LEGREQGSVTYGKSLTFLILFNFLSFFVLTKGTPTKGLSGDSDKSSSAGDRQFGVFLSEKQARVVSLPSQTCLYKQQICESSFVIKAEITAVKGI
jgi:hypothetical protein